MAKCVVVDKNLLEHPSLEEFLASDDQNRVVLPSFAQVELFAGSSAVNVVRSLKILSRFPRQVLLLRSSRRLAMLGPINSRFDMVDRVRTDGFPTLWANLRKVDKGDAYAEAWVVEAPGGTVEAQRILDEVRDQQDKWANFVLALREATSRELLKDRRAGRGPPAFLEALVLLPSILGIARSTLRDDPRVPPLPVDLLSASRCYVFRTAIAFRFLALRWAEKGGIVDAKPETLRNDYLDAMYAADATYWDGFLTRDTKARYIYEETRDFANLVSSCFTTG